MNDKESSPVEFIYDVGDWPIVRFNLPDLKGEFVVSNEVFEEETFIDIWPKILLVPNTLSGIKDGPYVVAIVRTGEDDQWEHNMLLLHWLHTRPQDAFLVFGEGQDPLGGWRYLDYELAENMYRYLLPAFLSLGFNKGFYSG